MFMERSLINSQQHTLIEIDCCGKNISAQAERLKRRVNKIKIAISGVIGIDVALLEILKVETIANGLRLRIDLYIDNATSTDQNYSDLLGKARRNGRLAKLMFDAWDLKSMPDITMVKCLDYCSKEMQRVRTDEL